MNFPGKHICPCASAARRLSSSHEVSLPTKHVLKSGSRASVYSHRVDWPGQLQAVLPGHRAPLDASSLRDSGSILCKVQTSTARTYLREHWSSFKYLSASASGDLSGGELEREHTEHIAPNGYRYTRKYRTLSSGHAYQRDTPGGHLRSVLPEHTDQIAPCGYDYARKYRTFNPGRSASMRTGHFPWRITALDHTGNLAPGGEPRNCTQTSRTVSGVR